MSIITPQDRAALKRRATTIAQALRYLNAGLDGLRMPTLHGVLCEVTGQVLPLAQQQVDLADVGRGQEAGWMQLQRAIVGREVGQDGHVPLGPFDTQLGDGRRVLQAEVDRQLGMIEVSRQLRKVMQLAELGDDRDAAGSDRRA